MTFEEQIIQAVAKRCHVTPGEIAAQDRRQHVVRARWLVWWILRRIGRRPLQSIARATGSLHHTTVIHGLQQADALIAGDPSMAWVVQDIQRELREAGALPPATSEVVNQ